ncbi:MAG: hypothetical protein DMG55_21040 [Acidobacteria bacterium]|nr:MAG: hypothetical protein DMG55_21040 [Acidobacteriota bacterium]
MSLRNRVALVTGGSRGIGRGLALRLAQDGARMAIAYRSNKVAAQQALRQLQAHGADCVAVETDITDAGRCDQLIKTVVDRFGRIDVIVNNVGDFRWGTLAESSLQDWEGIFTSNLAAAYAEGALGPNHQFGRRRRGTGIRAGENIGVCRCQGRGCGAVSFFGT